MPNVLATTFTFLGGQFQIGDGGSPENFTTIVQVKSVDFGSSKLMAEDVTSADNTDGAKRYVPTLYDGGDVSLDVLWNPADATHQSLRNAHVNRVAHNFKCVNPGTNLTWSFNGIVTSFDVKEHIDKPSEVSCKIKVNGPLTLA